MCAMNKRDVHDIFNCFNNSDSFNINLVAADARGNIGYMAMGTFPIRRHPYAG